MQSEISNISRHIIGRKTVMQNQNQQTTKTSNAIKRLKVGYIFYRCYSTQFFIFLV